jgi:hypothetical protein
MSFDSVGRRVSSVALVVAVYILAGCGGGTSTVRGKVSDQPGSQQQGLSSSAGEFGGSGTVSATKVVKAAVLGGDGSLQVIAEAEVDASGRYDLTVPSGEHRLILQAVDAQGQVVAQGILEASGNAGEQVTAAPLDTESSVEAAVLVEMVKRGSAEAETNAIDLRARINARVAAEVKAATDSGAKVRALADAVIAAQKTQVESYEQNGKTISQEALFQAQLQAAAKLNAALDRGDSAEQAYATFHADVAAALKAQGISEKQRAEAETCGSAAFRATVQARLAVGVGADAVAEAAVRQAAAYEAVATTAAVEATLRASGAADATITQATAAAATLRASLAAATTAAASAQAYAAYSAAITGEANVSGSVLGSYLAVNAANQAAVDAAIAASVQAAATLNATLDTTFETALSLTGTVNFSTMASNVVTAYATYKTAVAAQATALAIFGTKASAALDLMLVAEGSYRG